VGLMLRLSNQGKDFVQVSEKGVRGLRCRKDLDIECARQADNRQTPIRPGHTDIERLIAGYAEAARFPLAARFDIHCTTVLAHLERNPIATNGTTMAKPARKGIVQAVPLYKLKARTYSLVATYGGSTNFKRSISVKTLTGAE